jgi:citrate lyase subunit beta/citryl-CoA lyase
MPASNARALEKAKTIPCDALIFDLEDAVQPDAKETARQQAVAAAAEGGYGDRELVIRCNGLDTHWAEADITAAASAAPSAVLVPKVGSAVHVAAVAETLDAAGADQSVRIWAMIETPAGVLAAPEIARHERLDVLVMGTNDLANELRAASVPGRQPLLPHLAFAVLAARAAGKSIVDGVFNDLGDPDGFVSECRQGRDMGFDGKTLIHPSQVDPCNDAWTPTDDEVALAREVIAAFEQAQLDGRGAVTVRGKMIENLHAEQARRVLAAADAASRRR